MDEITLRPIHPGHVIRISEYIKSWSCLSSRIASYKSLLYTRTSVYGLDVADLRCDLVENVDVIPSASIIFEITSITANSSVDFLIIVVVPFLMEIHYNTMVGMSTLTLLMVVCYSDRDNKRKNHVPTTWKC